jgi:DNA invertase Pin-like site-specific DNA recombinase
MKQLIETIEGLRLRGIGFRSLTEAIDTTTAQGVLVFHLFSALAEFERALIRERTRAGLAAAKRMGRTGGRPAKLLDDDLDVARTLLANPDITVAEVADRVGVSPATLYRYLPAARTANNETESRGSLGRASETCFETQKEALQAAARPLLKSSQKPSFLKLAEKISPQRDCSPSH